MIDELGTKIDELTVIRNVVNRLEALDAGALQRALQYIADRFGYEVLKLEPGSHIGGEQG